MIAFVTIRGRKFDIIEQFEEFLVVQDLETKAIYSIKICFLDFEPKLTDTPDEMSNVLSIEWFKLNKEIKKGRGNGKKK